MRDGVEPSEPHAGADGHVSPELTRREPALARLVALARERLQAKQVWLFGSRARGDARPDSDWDVFLVLSDEAPDHDLDPVLAWRVGRDSGLAADVLSDREGDVQAARDVPNTFAFVLRQEGVRIG